MGGLPEGHKVWRNELILAGWTFHATRKGDVKVADPTGKRFMESYPWKRAIEVAWSNYCVSGGVPGRGDELL